MEAAEEVGRVIQPNPAFWAPSKGSDYENQELPPTEYFLILGLETHKLMIKYGLYPDKGLSTCYRCQTPGTSGDFAKLYAERKK